jgi:hypothetical protein
VVDGVEAMRLAVREELLKGASQIKIVASGFRPSMARSSHAMRKLGRCCSSLTGQP